MVRYSIIYDKNPREIILLRGIGCRWQKCLFCDYHLDSSLNQTENILLNRSVMSRVTGAYQRLEVINSGSFPELGSTTLNDLITLCKDKQIHTLHFECHWLYRNEIQKWRDAFAQVGTALKIKTGVESFNYAFREKILNKGISERDPAKIAEQFNECCLLFGIAGQSTDSMLNDVETGLACFERVCINIFVENQTAFKPDKNVINDFIKNVMPCYADNDRVDILLNNTDFGVGNTEAEHEK